jgi:hypothetical protein
MSYIGSTPTTQSFIAGTDYFNGDGSTTAFTLSRAVVSTNDIQATVNNVVQQPNTAYTVSGTTITFTSAPSAGTANIYVRYLSTTTQSITPSQNTVSYSTLNSDNQSKLGISFKNRIINGAMVIDQRYAGQATGSSINGYTIDRWAVYQSPTGKLNVQQNANGVSGPSGFPNMLGIVSGSAYSLGSGDYYLIRQSIEANNTADLAWGTANAKTVTLSFWVQSSLTGTFGCSLTNGAQDYAYPVTYTINAANTWQQVSITVPGPTAGNWYAGNSAGILLNFSLGMGSTLTAAGGSWYASAKLNPTGATSVVGTNGATFYLTGVQLEVGTQATTFDYRSYGTELSLCQRYYQYAGNGTSSTVFYAFPASGGSNFRVLQANMPVAMRTAPTVTYTAGGAGAFSTFYSDTNFFNALSNAGNTTTDNNIYGYKASAEL